MIHKEICRPSKNNINSIANSTLTSFVPDPDYCQKFHFHSYPSSLYSGVVFDIDQQHAHHSRQSIAEKKTRPMFSIRGLSAYRRPSNNWVLSSYVLNSVGTPQVLFRVSRTKSRRVSAARLDSGWSWSPTRHLEYIVCSDSVESTMCRSGGNSIEWITVSIIHDFIQIGVLIRRTAWKVPVFRCLLLGGVRWHGIGCVVVPYSSWKLDSGGDYYY